MTRKNFLNNMAVLTAATTLYNSKIFASPLNDFTNKRPLPADRKFTSQSIEDIITKIKSAISDKQLGWLFENCFPNTLDTTVDFEMINGKPDTYVITGDIDAMWLRDS
ncbi:MAG TPA: glycoside hydrolase family 125 protein, partial [Chitinophagaceae bacterium]